MSRICEKENCKRHLIICKKCGKNKFVRPSYNHLQFCSKKCYHSFGGHYSYYKKLKEEGSIEKLKNICSDAGKKAHIIHPELHKELYKKLKYWESNNSERVFDIRSKMAHISLIPKLMEWRKENPEKYKEAQKKAIENSHTAEFKDLASKRLSKNHKKWAMQNIERYKEKQANAGIKGYEATKKVMAHQMNLIYDSEFFASREEIEAYKFLKKLNIFFIHEYRIKNSSIDFLISNKIFWEHHPIIPHYNLKESIDEYYQRRRKLLDENGYKDNPLLITKSKNEFIKIKQYLENEKLLD